MDLVPALTDLIARQLRAAFDPNGPKPPVCAGTCPPQIHRFAGDTIALDALFDGDATCGGCSSALLWIRLERRYRTSKFPEESTTFGCDAALAVTIQVGIARCVDTGTASEPPKPENQNTEFLCLSDDAFRIDAALCRAAKIAMRDGSVTNYVLGAGEALGPQGGAVTWFQSATFELQGT